MSDPPQYGGLAFHLPLFSSRESTRNTNYVGNADAMRQAQGYTFCVYPPDDVGNADAISNARLTIMQSAEFFRWGVFSRHPLSNKFHACY